MDNVIVESFTFDHTKLKLRLLGTVAGSLLLRRRDQ